MPSGECSTSITPWCRPRLTGCRDQHGYGHLLQVDLPRGTWDAHALAVVYADFRPQHIRWKLPLRLASWMQSIR